MGQIIPIRRASPARRSRYMLEELYPFQREGVKFALSHHYTINACEMGLGKTAQALAALEHSSAEMGLVVCPAYLRSNWAYELKKWDIKTSVMIISYSQIRKYEHLFHNTDFVIFDEAHYLKTMTAKRTQAAHRLIKKSLPDYLMLLTGTPIKNRVAEFYSLIKMCGYNPRKTSGLPILGSYTHFADHLSYRQEFRLPYGGKAVKYTGLKNKPLLLKYLKGKYFRKVAKDVLKDLPRLVTNTLEIRDTDTRLDEQLESDWSEGGTHLSTAKAAHALSKSPHSAAYALELLDQECGPVLIFTDHIEACKRIEEEIRTGGGRTRSITGSTPASQRSALVDVFQSYNIDALVCTIGSMSTGFTLTASNRIIFNDLSWCPADNAQAAARIHRIGQTKPCFVTHMVSGGVDEMITKTLTEKMKTIKGALDV